MRRSAQQFDSFDIAVIADKLPPARNTFNYKE
jgi:hypothetical protein